MCLRLLLFSLSISIGVWSVLAERTLSCVDHGRHYGYDISRNKFKVLPLPRTPLTPHPKPPFMTMDVIMNMSLVETSLKVILCRILETSGFQNWCKEEPGLGG